VGLRVADAPAHVPVNHHALLLGRERRFGVVALQRQQTLVDVGHVLERRGEFEIQPWLGDHLLDLAELEQHAKLPLIDHEQHGTGQGQRHQQRRNEESDLVHVLASCPRLSGCRGRANARHWRWAAAPRSRSGPMTMARWSRPVAWPPPRPPASACPAADTAGWSRHANRPPPWWHWYRPPAWHRCTCAR